MDEVAQSTESAALVPIVTRGCERVVLAGDHCQLPPSVQSAEAEARGLSSPSPSPDPGPSPSPSPNPSPNPNHFEACSGTVTPSGFFLGHAYFSITW